MIHDFVLLNGIRDVGGGESARRGSLLNCRLLIRELVKVKELV
jgi:hypothetical protein